MSSLRFTATALAIAAITGMSIAPAQETPRGNQPATSQSPSTQADQAERYEARRVSPDSSQQRLTVSEAIIQKLKKVNDAEIELAKMAQQKSENQDLQQLTKMIIEDHQALNQALQQHAGQQQSQATGTDRTGVSDPSAQQQRAGRPGQAAREGQAARGRTGTAGSQDETVPQKLVQIAEQACDNALKMTKETLNEYDGKDFDMAFLGQQCFAHTMMLAELKAIQGSGPEELQEVAEKAISKVETHLDKVKQLAKKVANDRAKSE